MGCSARELPQQTRLQYAAAQNYTRRMEPVTQQAMRVPDELQRRLTFRTFS
ncbi:hypothetical protein Plhal304r1_c030g0098941 [Plasmopara halstedii]